MSQGLETLEQELNDLTRRGQILDALGKFYADTCTFEEGNGSKRDSKKAQHEYLSAFFKTLQQFNGATLHGQAVGKDFSTSEWTFDMTGQDGKRMLWNEVLVRRWQDGKVISEKFYQAS